MASSEDVENLINMNYSDLLQMLEEKAKYFHNMQNYQELIKGSIQQIGANNAQKKQILAFNLHPSDAEIEDEISQSKEKAARLIANATDDTNKKIAEEKQSLQELTKALDNEKPKLERWERIKKHRILYFLAGLIISDVIYFVPFVGGLADMLFMVAVIYVVLVSKSKVNSYQNIIEDKENNIQSTKERIQDEKNVLQSQIKVINNDILTKQNIQSRNERRLSTLAEINKKLDEETAKSNQYIEEFNRNSDMFYKDNIIPEKYWPVLDQLVDHLKNGEARDWVSATNLIITTNNFTQLARGISQGFATMAAQLQEYQQTINAQFASNNEQLIGLQNSLNNASAQLKEKQAKLDKQVTENGYKISRIKNVVAPEENH